MLLYTPARRNNSFADLLKGKNYLSINQSQELPVMLQYLFFKIIYYGSFYVCKQVPYGNSSYLTWTNNLSELNLIPYICVLQY